MKKRLMVIPCVLVGALCAETVYTGSDGSTFDVADGVLTITVPDGVTQASYDYVANILNVSTYGIVQVVKTGTGTLTGINAPNYTGAWKISAGVLDCPNGKASVLGKASPTPTDANAVVIEKGGCLRSNTSGWRELDNRIVHIAGSGAGTAAAVKGAIVNNVGSALYMKGSRLVLDDIASWYTAVDWGTIQMEGTSTCDLNGYDFPLCGGAHHWGKFYSTVFTNSSDETATTLTVPGASSYKTAFNAAVFRGGSRNKIDVTGSGRVYFEGNASCGDWTLSLKGSVRGVQNKTPVTAQNTYGWFGMSPVIINGTATVGNEDNTTPGYGLTLKGSQLTGVNTPKVVVNKGAWLSFNFPVIDYAGVLDLQGGSTDPVYRCTVLFQKNTPFLTTVDKTVTIKDSDLWMDAETVRQISSLSISGGKSTVTGSAAGSYIPAITVTGGATNILETPASIGTYTLTAGRLTIGTTMPDITNLVCGAGTAVDLGGRTLSVKTLDGAPEVLNGGSIETAQWNIDIKSGAIVTCTGGIVCPQDAKIMFTWEGGALPAGEREILYFAAGQVVPDPSGFVGQVAEGTQVAFSTREVTSGPHAGSTAVVATVTAVEPIQDETITDTDGTTLLAVGQVLTITVPGGVTNSYDYSTLVADHLITNIVKMGAGALNATALTTYDGDYMIVEGYFCVLVDGDLGRKNSGVVRVKDGGALCHRNGIADGAITYKTIEIEGAGPDGQGALRSPSVLGSYGPFRNIDYKLTGDAMVLYNGGRYDIRYETTLDVAGHTLTIRSTGEWSQMGYFSRCVITNSVPERGGCVEVCEVGTGKYPKFQLDGPSTWVGGTNNMISVKCRMYLGKTDGDWTLRFDSYGPVWGANNATSTTVTNANYFTGPVWVKVNGTFGYCDYGHVGPISLYGPIYGAAERTLTLSGPIHLFSDMSGYEGTLAIDGTPSAKNATRNGVWIHDGCDFHCGAGKRIGIKYSDLTLDAGTAFRLPDFKHTGDDITVSGGARGDSAVGRSVFASFETTASGKSLIFSSPAIVAGEMKVTAGTLALGTNGLGSALSAAELPVFSNLVFAAGTTFNMNGSALTVPNLMGFPVVTNAGPLTIGESWTVADAASTLATDSTFGFASDATIAVPGTFSPVAGQSFTVCTAAGGIVGDLPLVVDPRKRPWRVETSDDGKSLLLTRIQDGTFFIFR